MSDENAKEPLSNESNSSFVVLGSGSFISVTNDENVNKIVNDVNTVNLPDFCMEKNHNGSPPVTFTIDADLQQKLNQLLKENYQLKETLSQNNLAIKTQLNIFFMWQQEVLKMHETHKQKFLETKDLVLKLKAENLNLKMQLESNSKNCSFVNGLDFELESNESHIEKMRMTFNNMEKLKEEIKKYELMYSDLKKKNESLSIENYDLQKTVKDSKEEMLKVNKVLDDKERENVYLRQKISQQQGGSTDNIAMCSLPNSEARVQIRNLFKQLDEEKEKVLKLKQELEKTKVANEVIEEKKNPTEELSEYLNELNDMDESFKRQSERINNLSSWIYLTEENLVKSKTMNENCDSQILSDIAQLKNQLNKEENVVKEKKENLHDMNEQFKRLLKDYKELQEKLNHLELNVGNSQSLKKEIEKLSLELKSKDEQQKEKDLELSQLNETVRKLNLECEEVAILRVQMEVYKTDFNDERAAREKLVGEKEEMAEQIRRLKMVLSDLEKEKNNRQCQKEEQDKETPDSTENSPLKNNKSHYKCPKCLFSFSDLRRCEEHVNECIDVFFYP